MSKDYYSQLRNEQNGPSFSPRQIDRQREAAERRQEEKLKAVRIPKSQQRFGPAPWEYNNEM